MFGPLLESEMSSFEKVHAVVARSRFRSQNVQNTPCSDHFWSLRCRVLKKCTPLWREAQFQVKMYKTHHARTTFGGSDVASLPFASLHYTTLHDTTLHYTGLGCASVLSPRSCNRRPTMENNAVSPLAGIGFGSTTGNRYHGI